MKRTKEDIESIVTEYLGTDPNEVEVVEDPKFPGTFAIRAEIRSKPFVDNIFFLLRKDSDELEEVEFKSWPPRSSKFLE
jgi:hypothetical protein